MQIQKKKIIVGPNDSVGILLFNTVRFVLPLEWGLDFLRLTKLFVLLSPYIFLGDNTKTKEEK